MKFIYKIIYLIGCLCFLYPQTVKSSEEDPVKAAEHSRLFLSDTEWKQLVFEIQEKNELQYVHNTILKDCERILLLDTQKMVMEGKTMLGTCREALRRILYLSYAYRITGDKKYFIKCKEQLKEVCNTPSWNPAHFLDVAELTFAVAIGYDWLYESLDKETKEILKEAILYKGLLPSTQSNYNGWSNGWSNWNQVCNAGIAIGAIAVYEEAPEFCKSLIEKAKKSIQLPMKIYGPDGAYPEGYNYWAYGTTYNVLFIDALDKIFKTDFGLSDIPGFMESARYIEFMTGAQQKCFNYSDGGEISELQPQTAMFWFAQKKKDTSLLWVEKEYLKKEKEAIMLQNRFLPFFIIWSRNIDFEKIKTPDRLMWAGNGENPVVAMRSSWCTDNGFYVGIKGGTPTASHAHMDVGSFVFDYGGVRWAMDFGAQNYYTLESKKLDIWKMDKNSDRWKVFRYNNMAHNTLTFDNQLQKVDGHAPMYAVRDGLEKKSVTFDLSDIYSGVTERVMRTAELQSDKVLIIKDEIKTDTNKHFLRWNMLTSAGVTKYNANTFQLKKEGKCIYMVFECNRKLNLRTWSTTSPNSYDQPNPGTIFLGAECLLPVRSKTDITVYFIPEENFKRFQNGQLVNSNEFDVDKVLDYASEQVVTLADTMMVHSNLLPRTFDKMGNKLVTSDSRWWTSGFFPGTLWYLYEYKKDPKLGNYAREMTARVEKEKYTTDNHDVGFMLYCSFGNGLRITGNKQYEDVLLTGAKSLSSRFNPEVGVIKSWEKFNEYNYPVIIDNMMNLELLMWAFQYSGDPFFKKIALSHADKTMINHFRNDYSSYHVVTYDERGNALARRTHQGYGDESAWARGQAWGLYGYTMMYRETKDVKYLDFARKIASFIIHHPNLPTDKIFYWDFNAPDIPDTPRDVSAAAVASSALLELSTYVGKKESKEYFKFAESQLAALSSFQYLCSKGENNGFILKHSVGSFPHQSEVDVPLTYADYYFVEALLRYKRLTRKE